MKRTIYVALFLALLVVAGCSFSSPKKHTAADARQERIAKAEKLLENPFSEKPLHMRQIMAAEHEYMGKFVTVGPLNVGLGTYSGESLEHKTLSVADAAISNLGTMDSHGGVTRIYYGELQKSNVDPIQLNTGDVIFAKGVVFKIAGRAGVSAHEIFYKGNWEDIEPVRETPGAAEKEQQAKKMLQNPFPEETVPVRQLEANVAQYANQTVRVGPLEVSAISLERKLLDSWSVEWKKWGGSKSILTDLNTNVRVYYKNLERSNINPAAELRTGDILFVKGRVLPGYDFPIIEAQEMIVTGRH